MAIPKIIHYCWFGHTKMPDLEIKCIESWKKHFPGYEIKLWNEENFDYKSCTFAKQAYEKGQYAFVSDYARAKILYNYGGIYMDADVEVLKDFSEALSQKAFLGFERRHFVGTAIMATEKNNPVIKALLDYYESHPFILEDGSMDRIANVSLLTDILSKKGLQLGGMRQTVDGIEIYNREVFYPKKIDDDTFRITEETCAIHRASNSWMSDKEKRRGRNKLWIEVARPTLRGSRKALKKLLGEKKTRKIENKLRDRMK